MIKPLTPPYYVDPSVYTVFNLFSPNGTIIQVPWRDGSWWAIDENQNQYRMTALEAAQLGWRF